MKRKEKKNGSTTNILLCIKVYLYKKYATIFRKYTPKTFIVREIGLMYWPDTTKLV